MNILTPPARNKVLCILLCGWLLTVLLAIVVHWRVLRYFALLFLVGAILFFLLSLLYSFVSDGEDQKNTPKK